MDQFKDQVLREIRSNGIQKTMEDILGVVKDEVLKFAMSESVVPMNEWHLIRNMLEAIINGPCDRLQHPQRYGNIGKALPYQHREACGCPVCLKRNEDNRGRPVKDCQCSTDGEHHQG